MADETIGSLGVEITGDSSELQKALDEAAGSAEKTARDIQDAFTNAGGAEVENLVHSLDDLVAQEKTVQETFQQAVSVFNDVQTAFNNGEVGANVLEGALEQLKSAAADAGQELKGVGEGAGESGHGAEEGAEGFKELAGELLKIGGIALTAEKAFETIRDTITEAFQAFSQVQTATTALTALTHDAAGAVETIENLKGLAVNDALSFPVLIQATQRMTAFGIETAKIPLALQGAADAAAATGFGLDAVTNAIERMSLSGNAGTKQLVQLGLSARDLGQAMGISAGEVKEAFKDLDVSDRAQVIIDALDKFKGAAQAVAQTLAGQWQTLKTQMDFALEDIGKGLAPLAEAFIALASKAVESTRQTAAAFANLSTELSSTFSDLGAQSKSFWNEMVPADIQSRLPDSAHQLSVAVFGPIREELQGATEAVKKLHDGWNELVTLFGGASSGMGAALAADLKKATDAANDANRATLDLGKALVALSPEVKAAEDSQKSAATAVKAASDALAEEKARIDAGQGSLAAYSRLLNEYDAAVQKATPHTKDFADSFAGIVEAANKSEAQLSKAIDVFNQISKAYSEGKVSALALAEAESKLEAAYKAVNGTLSDHLTGVQKIFEETGKATQAWIEASGTLKDMASLFLKGQASAQDLAAAIAQAGSAAQKAGAQFVDPGSGIAAAVQILGDKAGDAAVIVNGKLVPTMEAAAKAAQQAHDDFVQCASDIDATGASADVAAIKVIKLTDAMSDQTTAVAYDKDALDGLIDKYYAAADAAAAAANATNSLADAEENEDQVSSTSSSHKGGGKGGGGLSASATLGLYASAGADNFELDQIAQALGLVPVGNRQYITKEEYAALTGYSFGANGGLTYTGKTGQPGSWTAGGSTGTGGGSSSTSGVTALDTAAGHAAQSVANLGTTSTSSSGGLQMLLDAANGTGPGVIALGSAASNAAVPLGAFATSVDGATPGIIALSNATASLTQISGDLSDAEKQQAESGLDYLQTLAKVDPALQAFADKSASAAKAQESVDTAANALSQAIDRDIKLTEQGLVTQEDATKDILKYQVALDEATRSLSSFGTGLVDLTKAVDKLSQNVNLSTNVTGSDVVNSGTSPTAYDDAIAKEINANDALTNALRSGAPTSVTDGLFKAASAAQDAARSLERFGPVAQDITHGIDVMGTTFQSTNSSLQVANAGLGAFGQQLFQATQIVNGQVQTLIGNAQDIRNLSLGLTRTGAASTPTGLSGGGDLFKSYVPPAGGDNLIGTGGMGAFTNTQSSGVQVNVTVTGNTVVGSGGMDQLVDKIQSGVVSRLRQSGAKI